MQDKPVNTGPLDPQQIAEIFRFIHARTGSGIDKGAGAFTLVSTVEKLHGWPHMPTQMYARIFEHHAKDGFISDLATATTFVREIESMHGLGIEQKYEELQRQRDSLHKLISWVSDECKMYPETSEEKEFAQRLLSAIHHPKSGFKAITSGQAQGAAVELVADEQVKAPLHAPLNVPKADQVLLLALDLIEGVASGGNPADLPRIAQDAKAAIKEYRVQKKVSDEIGRAQEQVSRAAAAKTSQSLAHAYSMIKEASDEIRQSTRIADLADIQFKLAEASKKYHANPASFERPADVQAPVRPRLR